MKRFIHIILILLVGLVSCQKAPFLTFTGQRNLSFKDNGGTETITFSCNNVWIVSSSANWLKVSPSQGSANEGGVKVTITCEANTTYDPRTGTVTIMSEGITETISVSQDTNYGLMSEPTTFNLTNAAQNIEVEVKANVEYTITIDDAGKDWISQVGTKALSATKLTFSIVANEGYDDREGKITISQKGSASSVQPQVITVKQSQTNGLFITTPEYELSNEAHDLTVEVKANIDYEVTSEVDWVKYEPSATKALTTSSFTLKVEKNESYDTRVGTVKVKGGGLEGVVTITQAETLGLFVSPTEKSISEDAQEVEVEVNANVEYDIIVPDEAKGMITTVKKQGGETKALSATKYLFGVSENTTYEGREASITFKQKDGALCGTIKISQEQTDCLYILKPEEYNLSQEAHNLQIEVMANVEYEVLSDVNWIRIMETKSLHPTTISLGVDSNKHYKERIGIVTIKQKGGGLSCSVKINQDHENVCNLSAQATANCYIVSKSGWYSIDAIHKGNSQSIVIENATMADVLWESFNTEEVPNIGSLIKDIALEEESLYFRINDNFRQGNALVCIRNNSKEILWSWHIWCTDADIDGLGNRYSTGSVFMDRNLGALSCEPGDVLSLGLLYQWGRKDPFLSCSIIFPDTTDSSGPVASATTGHEPSVKNTSETGTIEYSIQHPITPIACDGRDSYDWLSPTLGTSDATRWAKEKTIYDPCPIGWHVPDESEWVQLFGSVQYYYSFTSIPQESLIMAE